MIIDHTHPQYIKKWQDAGANRWNGAYYYSKEIVERIIPAIDTDRNWITVNIKGVGCHNAIVFIHNNLRPSNYDWLRYYGYKNLILVCGVPETCEKVADIGTPIYLPLSIDVDYVKQFAVENKTKDAAFVGRPSKKKYGQLPEDIDILEGMPREELLRSMAEFRNVFAVGRCAIEAKALGANILSYDNRFPDPSVWRVMDNLEAAEILQKELDRIDGKGVREEVL